MLYLLSNSLVALIGGGLPIVFLALRSRVAPSHDEVRRRRSTRTAYVAFRLVGWVTLIAYAIAVLLIRTLDRTDPEWALGVIIIAGTTVYPALAVMLLFIAYGFYRALDARRDPEFVLIAVHSSLTYVVAFFLLLHASGNVAQWIYLAILGAYPFSCLLLSWLGSRRDSAPKAGNDHSRR